MEQQEFIISENELGSFIKQHFSKQPHIYLLSGNLGSGKTTFVKIFLEYLGFDPTTITSPTYTIIQTYHQNEQEVHHLDLYRLPNKQALESIHFNEIITDKTAICLIEWPELITPIDSPHTVINFSHIQDINKRRIKLTKNA